MEVREWLGEKNQLGVDIWEKKYRYNNETFDEWLDRISGGYEELRKIIAEKKFLPAGRILAHRGLEKYGLKFTLSNCYVVTPPEDSIESIYDCAKKMARTYSYGGGSGVDVSKLAPRGAKVNNTAKKSSGAVSFMALYDLTASLIGQGGRRAAAMITIDCSHPDIEEFIEIKTDISKINKANLSIKVTDEFMNAVKNDEIFYLEHTRESSGETISVPIKAKALFRKIAEANWDYAEPGCLFWDRIKNWTLLSETENFEFAGTNPCFTGDMKLLTSEGYRTFEELCGKDFFVTGYLGSNSKGKVWETGVKQVIELSLSNGEKIKCTPDHIFLTIDMQKSIASGLKSKKIMPFLKTSHSHIEDFVKYGFIQGDGQLTRLKSNYHKGIEVNIGKNDSDVLDLFRDDVYSMGKNNRVIYLSGYNEKLKDLGFSQEGLLNREFPSTYNSWGLIEKASFLRGCYSANGCCLNSKNKYSRRVQYKTTSINFARQLSETLEKDFGISSYITTNKSKNNIFSNGEYVCRESYDVNIYKFNGLFTFFHEIGFCQKYKTYNLYCTLMMRAPYVISIKDIGVEKVYDFTEPSTHWGVVNGFVAHNCAEEPLPAGGSCLLGSINLSEFVENPFSKNAEFNYESFEKTVEIAVKGLNDILDEGLPLHPLEEQRESVKNWRQIGCGIMGLSDMLIKLGVEYGSSEAIKICENIASCMLESAFLKSCELAKNAESFPQYSFENIIKSQFYKDNLTASKRLVRGYNFYKDKLKECGLRNSQLLTIPPCGTIATMLGISSGIEPIFANSYTRKTESLHGKDVAYKVYTPIVEEYMQRFGLTDESELPDYFVTSKDIALRNRIDMQATWQRYIDASISSTVNVPNEFTVEQVEELYMYAWEQGLKGITIFRDGCKRLGILTTDDKKEKPVSPQKELGRGFIYEINNDVIGKKRKLTTGCGSLHCIAFFDPFNGDLLETYLSKGSTGGCNNFMVGLSRMISLSARAGCDINSIINQLDSCGVCPSYAVRKATAKDTSKGSCCPMAIGNALLDMHKEVLDELGLLDVEDKELNNGQLCPECQEPMVAEGGCVSCKACGWSKCS